jgi:hypothetical protein
VGVLVDAKSDYSIGLARVFAERFAALGGTVRQEPTPGVTPTSAVN